MQQYEDDRLQYYGRKLVPVQQLTENVLERMRSVQKEQKADSSTDKDPDFDDLFLVELTKWFKESFFEWVNTIPCKVCHEEKKGRRVSSIENGLRVEVNTIFPNKFPMELLNSQLQNVNLFVSFRFYTVAIHKRNSIDTMTSRSCY